MGSVRPRDQGAFEGNAAHASEQRRALRIRLAGVQSRHWDLCRARRKNTSPRKRFQEWERQPMNGLLGATGRLLARYLAQPLRGYEPLATHRPALLRGTLRPCDVLLVEGNTRISTAIKYLTQSTWSHAALYIGDAPAGNSHDPDPPVLIEADLEKGVWAVPLSHYDRFHVRICRPVGLTQKDARHVVEAATARLGQTYDLKNIVDLCRYLLPTP